MNKINSLINDFNIQKDKIIKYDKEKAYDQYIEISNTILKSKPDKIICEITEDESLFYTVIKKEYKIYIEYYFDDSTTLSHFYKNNKDLNSYSNKNINEIVDKIIKL